LLNKETKVKTGGGDTNNKNAKQISLREIKQRNKEEEGESRK